MKKLLTLIFLCTTFLSFGQQSLNMTLRSNPVPSNVTIGYQERFNDVWGYADNGNEYAIFGSSYGTHFYDVTNPDSPIEVDFIEANNTSDNSWWRDFKTYGHYAYAVADVRSGNALQIFDLQYLPDSVVEVYNDNEFTSNCHNIHVNNDRLYLISNTRNGGYYPVDILCLKDPADPELIGGIWSNTGNVTGNYGTSHDAFVKDDTVYLSVYGNSFGNNGLHVFDCTQPHQDSVYLIGSITNYPGSGLNHASWMSDDGDYLRMVDELLNSPSKMVDISDLQNMQTVSTFEPFPGSIAHNPTILNCLAIMSYYHEGVQIYDISDPANPNQVGFYRTDTTLGQGVYSPNYASVWGIYPYLPSGNILATDRKYGLHVLTYNGPQPSCSGDEELVVEMDTTRLYCYDTTSTPGDTTTIGLSQNLSAFSIYPNPSEGRFIVQAFDRKTESIRVYGLDGKEIIHFVNEENKFEFDIDLSQQDRGMYILEIESSGKLERHKIFKN